MSHKPLGVSEATYLSINTAAADTELVAAVAGKRIRVNGLVLTCSAALADLTLQSDGAGDTEIAAFQVAVVTTGGLAPIVLPIHEAGWCETGVNEALDLRHTGTTAVDGVLVYTLMDA